MSEARRYRIVRQLGSGLSGAVYLSETDSGAVAVRQFRSQHAPDSAEARADCHSFLAAARRAATLEHPQITATLDVIDEEGGAFIAVEYVAGDTLESRLSREQFTPAQANIVLRGIADTLDYAHRKGVFHGDLKPSNVFLLPDGRIKVSDFAISPRARAVRQPFPQEWSHFYLSPEHLLLPESVGPWSDQYSLGAIAYHLYTGRPPFADSAGELGSAIRFGKLATPSSVRAGLSQSTERALLKALSRDPQQRYASEGLFVDRLEASLEYAETAPLPRKRSSPLLYLGAGAVLLALLVAGLLLMRPGRSSHTTAARGAPPSASVGPGPAAAARPTPAPEQTKVRAPLAKTVRQQPRDVAGAAAPRMAETRLRTSAMASPATPPTPPREPPLVPAPVPEQPTRLQPAAPPRPTAPPGPTTPEIAIFSRTRKIDPGSSFGYRDPDLGEMAYGDLKAVVQAAGPAPKGKLTLEWCLDDLCLGPKPVRLNQPMDYANEPTAGAYRIILRMNSRPINTFVFRITP